MAEVHTHCPYCSLQCGMTLTPRDDADGGGFAVEGANFPTNRGGLCEKGLSLGRAARPPRPPDHPAGPRRPRRAVPRGDAGTRRSTGSPTAITDAQQRHGRDAAGLLRRRRADQREGLPGRQVRPGRAAQRVDRLQRPVLHVLGRRRGEPGLRDRPGHAVPARRHRPRRHGAARRLQPGRHDAARDALVRRRARPRRAATSSSTPATPRPRRRPTCTCSRCPAPTSPWPTACCTSRSSTASSTTAYVRDRTTGWAAVRRAVRQYWPDRVERITGVPVADHGAHRPRCSPRRAPTMILSARGAEQHAKGSDTALAWINLALALGLPGPARTRAGRR